MSARLEWMCARTFSTLALAALLLFAASCAMRSQVARPVAPMPRSATAALLGDIGMLSAQQRATSVCPDVCRLAEKICEAASKICDIAAEHGREDPDLTDRCSNASVQCAVARRRCGECR